MKKFLFHIDQRYLPAIKIISPYYATVRYEVVDNRVVVNSIELPYEILQHFLINCHFIDEVYAAAENNAHSFDLVKQDANFDLFKELGTYFNPSNVKS